MTNMIEDTIHYFTDYDNAHNCAMSNNENDDDGWSYTVERIGKYYAVAVFDEDNEKVGYL